MRTKSIIYNLLLIRKWPRRTRFRCIPAAQLLPFGVADAKMELISFKDLVMNLQDRAFAVGIFIIIGICCIGVYVGISGFNAANPNGFTLALNLSTNTPPASPAINVSAETAEAATATSLPTVTSGPPTNTPKGFKPSATPPATATSLSRGTPSPAFLGDIPTVTPISGTPGAVSTATATAPTTTGNCGYPYCPRPKGPPSEQAPTGNICPQNYLWGFVLDASGKGVSSGVWIRFTNPNGEGDKVAPKTLPDPPGRWDVSAGGGTWKLQLVDQNNNPLSPTQEMQAFVKYTTGNSCPTRLDFVKQ